MVSMMDHDKIVCLMLRLKYSLNSQKPVSFTWENMRLPEPIASTINSALTMDDESNGRTIPAVVSAATVAEPNAIRIHAAMSQPMNKGDSEVSLSIPAI